MVHNSSPSADSIRRNFRDRMGGVSLKERFNIELVKQVQRHKVVYDTFSAYTKDEMEHAWREIAQNLKIGVQKCKHRWRNIRHAFLRYLRTNSVREVFGGKPYYLAKYLGFYEPFARFRSRYDGPYSIIEDFPLKQELFDDDDDDNNDDIEICDEENDESINGLQQQEIIDIEDSSEDSNSLPPSDDSVDIPSISLVHTKSLVKKETVDESYAAENNQSNTNTTTSSSVLQGAHQQQQKEQQQQQQQQASFEEDPDLNFFKSLLPELKLLSPRQKIQFRSGILSNLAEILADIPTASIPAVSSTSLSTPSSSVDQ